ncbi:hypothetical protein BHE74_00054825 [Ensete ventricosum]|nr:hypothetical protein BHE74_00054825 [Ensete ventricosum]
MPPCLTSSIVFFLSPCCRRPLFFALSQPSSPLPVPAASSSYIGIFPSPYTGGFLCNILSPLRLVSSPPLLRWPSASFIDNLLLPLPLPTDNRQPPN